MLEFALDPGAIRSILTLLILAGALYGFISERLAPDVTSLLALLSLLMTGILTPSEAFSGFSHPATISVAAVLVLSAAVERTGALTFLARRLLTPLGSSELVLTLAIMLVISALSAFVNNTAAVAVFIPVVIEVCRRTQTSTSRILMPMSHAATFGGMCTLVGTSTNLVAHEFALSHGLSGFSMFELGKVGLPMLVAGYVYMLFVGKHFLPKTSPIEVEALERSNHYIAELTLGPTAPLIGRPVNASTFELDFDVELINLMRSEQVLDPHAETLSFVPFDSLLIRGPLEKVLALGIREGFELHRPGDRRPGLDHHGDVESSPVIEPDASPTQSDTPDGEIPSEMAVPARGKLPLAEVVVLTTSGLIGYTLREARFAERFDTLVLALRRRGELNDRPSAVPLLAGDMLLVEGRDDALKALAQTRGFLVVGTPAQPEGRPSKLLITLLTLISVITAVSLGILPIVTAAGAGCAILILTGCLRPAEVYRAIDLSLVFILAGSLALGAALDKTGLTTVLANWLTHLSGATGPFVLLVGFFMISVVISELMSNSGTVALLGPVALSVAAKMGINPMALLAAVTFGSSAAFAMPIGYQTSLMIYGPGGYRVKDFIRMGIPLDVLLAVLALALIPIFWPM